MAGTAAQALMEEVGRLTDRLAGATPTWYAARPRAAETYAAETYAAETYAAETYAAETRAAETRAQTLRGLVAELGRLGQVAGTGAPAGVLPPVLGDHALAYQLVVLAHELTTAPTDLTAAAVAAVRAARDRL